MCASPGDEEAPLQQVPDKACLIVNYLPQSMTEKKLVDIFEQIGPVKSSRIMYDKSTGTHYGYGFVTYVDEQDAGKAIESLNGFEIDNKTLKVSYSRPQSKETKNSGLCVRNLPESYTESDVRNLFQDYGTIVQIRMPRNYKGMAFIIMSTRSEARSALDSLQSLVLDKEDVRSRNGLLIEYIRHDSRHRQQRNSSTHFHQVPGSEEDSSNALLDLPSAIRTIAMYQNQLVAQASQQLQSANPYMMPLQLAAALKRPYGDMSRPDDLLSSLYPFRCNPLCAKCGAQSSSSNESRHSHKKKKSCAHETALSFPTNALGVNIGLPFCPTLPLANPGGTFFPAASIPFGQIAAPTGNFGRSPVDDAQSKRLSIISKCLDPETCGFTIYVYGFGPDPNERKLKRLFENYGKIERMDIIRDPGSGESKGYGFVVFANYGDACAAIEALDGTMLHNRKLQVRFKG